MMPKLPTTAELIAMYSAAHVLVHSDKRFTNLAGKSRPMYDSDAVASMNRKYAK